MSARATLLAALLAVAGCAVPQPERIDAAQLRETERTMLDTIRTLRGRLFRISYTLRAGAPRLCGEFLLPDAGLLFAAAGATALVPAGLEIVHVVAGSPLARAGVHEGDVVLELEGRRVLQVAELNAALPTAGPARLTLQRGADRYQVSAELARACGVPVQLAADTGLMTFQDGPSVAVPYGLLESASDDWLAIAIAHQIAHVLLGFATQPVEDPEATADQLGLLIAAEAGFDVSAAPAFWTWLAMENPWRIASTRGFRIRRPDGSFGSELEYSTAQLHLGIARRLPAIRAGVSQILAARSARR